MPKALKHTLIWLAYFVYVVVTDRILDGPELSYVAEVFMYLSHNILLFYTLLYCYRHFNAGNARQLAFSVFRFAAALLIFLLCRYLVIDQLLTRTVSPEFGKLSPLKWWTLALLWISWYAVITLAFHYFGSYSRKRKEYEALAEERLLQEQQKLSLENKLLRAQIDPHFLYNALNALYAKALPLSEDLGEAILKLSEIMRYAVKPNPTSRTAPLREELDHLRNIIDIARFRFNNKIFLELEIEGDFGRVDVLPLAFITLAENVLKHAQLTDPAAPGRIHLQWLDTSVISFTTWNKKRSSNEFPSNGIGLNNTIQRLKDHYGDACKIAVEDGVDYFHLVVLLNVDMEEMERRPESLQLDKNRL
jgi:two-component system LytT family sensor kinase